MISSIAQQAEHKTNRLAPINWVQEAVVFNQLELCAYLLTLYITCELVRP